MSDRILKLAFGAAVVLLVIVHWSFKPRPSADEIKRHSQAFTEPRDWANRLAPDFEMPLLDGSTFRLRRRHAPANRGINCAAGLGV